ncbi:MAG: L,D-transpeptidase [Ktedonobacterales bacterium]
MQTQRIRSSSGEGLLPASSFASTLSLAIIVAAMLISGCAQAAPNGRAIATENKAMLDRELRTAQVSAGVPQALLQPIEQQEGGLTTAMSNGSDKDGQAAAVGYEKLYNQVVALVKLTPDQIHQRATHDLQSFVLALQPVENQGFVEAATYHAHLQQAQQQLVAATTAKEYFAADGYILDQTSAVAQIIPVYHQIQSLESLVSAQAAAQGSTSQPLECAVGDVDSFWESQADILSNWGLDPSSAVMVGNNTQFDFQSWPTEDIAAFRAADTEAAYATVSAQVQAQMVQLAADKAALLPQQTSAAVKQFQADAQTYQQDGGQDTSFQQQADQDAQNLASATTMAAITVVSQTVQTQRQAFALPLAKVEAEHDMQTLTNLVLEADSKTTVDPYNNIAYPDGYEYIGIEYDDGHNWAADPLDKYDTENYLGGTGIGDARARLANAQTLADYTAVDSEIQMFITNIQAMLTNLAQMPTNSAARQAWSMTAHQTDIDLIDHYGLQNTNVIVVSLREQEARLYTDGKLVVGSDGKPYAFQITTGNPDLPSVPGLHCATQRLENYEDVSPFPKSSPYYYNPTFIHYGMVYSDYGFLVHDAWWRDNADGSGMGYLTNLPHYDPIAFNSGSHGCINFHYANGDMLKVWNFSNIGTPVLVY